MRVAHYIGLTLLVSALGAVAVTMLWLGSASDSREAAATSGRASTDYRAVVELERVSGDLLVALDVATVESSSVAVVADRLLLNLKLLIRTLEESPAFKQQPPLCQVSIDLDRVVTAALTTTLLAPDSRPRAEALDAYDAAAQDYGASLDRLLDAADAIAAAEVAALDRSWRKELFGMSAVLLLYGLLVVLFWRWMVRRLIGPLGRLTDAVVDHDGTSALTLADPAGPMEIAKFGSAFSHLVAELRQKVTVVEQQMADRHVAQAELREARDRYRELAETIDDVFWVVDVDPARFLYVNPAFERVWGLVPEQIYADVEQWFGAIDEDDRGAVRDWLAAPGARDESREFRIRRPDGGVRWIRARIYTVEEPGGRPMRRVGLAQDVTRTRELEARLVEAKKMESVGRLAAGVAHDYNNIVTVILGNASLLRDDPPATGSVGWTRSLTDIIEASKRAAALTRQLLLFSRQQEAKRISLDMQEMIPRLSARLEEDLGPRVQLTVMSGPDPCFVNADPGHMDQLVGSLALNARDAMPDGGRLTIATERVTLGPGPGGPAAQEPRALAGDFIRLTVKDTGVGIEPESLPRVFDPFFTTKEVGRGAGLGLATVYGIVEEHDGWIEIDSEPGVGTEIRVFLPEGERPPADASPTARVIEPKAPAASETILAVEDQPEVLALAATLLRRRGYTVLTATNAAEALGVWSEARDGIDLLFTDVVMPGELNGVQLARRLLAERPDLRVVYTSGYTDEVIEKEAAGTEGSAFLGKPYAGQQLMACIDDCLKEGTKADTGVR